MSRHHYKSICRSVVRATAARAAALLICLGAAAALAADDWPMWGHDASRNMVSADKDLPVSIDPGKPKEDGTIDLSTVSKNVKWVSKLGTQTYGNPTVSSGKVFLGTNNGFLSAINAAGL